VLDVCHWLEWEKSYRRAIRSDNAVFRMRYMEIYTRGFQEDRRVAIKLAFAGEEQSPHYSAIHRYFKTTVKTRTFGLTVVWRANARDWMQTATCVASLCGGRLTWPPNAKVQTLRTMVIVA
jgi:hypothetical protein